MIEIPGLLIEITSGESIGVPGWIVAPSLREAMFAVAFHKGRYNISHVPTRRGMPFTYGSLEDALTVCGQLEKLLADDDFWWDPFGPNFPFAITDWRRDHEHTYAEMMRIVREPAGRKTL